MPVAKKQSDLRVIADQDEDNKIELEKPFKSSINTFLRRINTEFSQQYMAEGTVIDANAFKPELVALLGINYNRIAKIFKKNIRESFTDKVSVEVAAQIDNNINKYIKDVSNQKSEFILDTTNRDIAQEIADSVTDLVENEQEVTTVSIADKTRKSLNEGTEGRSTIISITETENMAESTKTLEEQTLINNDIVLGGVVLAAVLKDVWITTLDEVTRPAHAQANLQEKRPFESFMVGGELLRQPGDPQGSIWNIANCRCSKVTKIF